MTRVAIAGVLVAGLATAVPSEAAKARPQAAATLFVMAAQDSGGLGTSGPVLRCEVRGPTRTPTLERTIDDPSFFWLCCFAFTRSGEMLVVNRGDPFSPQSSCISRILDPQGNPSPNGAIAVRDFSVRHWAAFRHGQLFVANARGNSISRFKFDTAGIAKANGQITGAALSGPAGVDFSPWGELFVGNTFAPGGVSRWTFNSSGAASFNGSFSTPSNVVIDIQFGPQPCHDRIPGTRGTCDRRFGSGRA